MPTINQLNSVSTPSASDLLPLYSQSNGDARQLSLSNLLNWIEENIALPSTGVSPFPQYTTQYAAPSANNFTVNVTNSNANIWLILTPTAGFASGTLVLPNVTSAIDKQEILVNCTQQIAALTINGNGATAVTGEPTSLGADDFFRLRYDLPTHSWYRVG